MRTSTLLNSLSVFVAGVRAQWTMPSQFAFNETADFHWKVQNGINILSISVLASLNPSNIIPLPMGLCKVMDVEKQKCAQYTNNGTATFGGSYAIAAGLSPGVSYFISIAWITTDRSDTGTANSPAFQMAYPPDPNPPTGFRTSAVSTSETTSTDTRATSVKQVATSTKTIHVSLAIQTDSTLSSSTLPSALLTPSSDSSLSHIQRYPHSLTTAAKAGIAVGGIFFTLSVTCLIIFITRSSLARKHSHNTSSAHNMDADSPFTRRKDDPSMRGSLSNDTSLRNCGVPAAICELDGDVKEPQQSQMSLRGARGVDLMAAYPQPGYKGPVISSTYPSPPTPPNAMITGIQDTNTHGASRMLSELEVQRVKHVYQPGIPTIAIAAPGTACGAAGCGTLISELSCRTAGEAPNHASHLPPPVYPGDTPELDGTGRSERVQGAYDADVKLPGAPGFFGKSS